MKVATKNNLDIIVDRLMDSHASLFVGAGFSKNAQLLSGSNLPPDWNELGDLFFEKARGHKPSRKEREYANVLRLAEEVECVCGRDVLSSLITDAINDDNLEPSNLHVQLLSLPWKDVFTTNYDTLLERAANILNEQAKRVYSFITNDQQIGLSSQPFLMKLHGDIKEPGSIIITEEDYRQYPAHHQAMIGHIQHTIMLETLVLIGFSGNDPNFIQWLGWVKDALSNNQRKVYLLTVDKVSDSLIKTFEKKNVIIVDLHNFAGKGAKPSENIEAAIQYIHNLSHKREQESEQYRKQALAWGRTTSAHEKDIKVLYDKWKKERDSYPGWLVMPRDRRETWTSVGGYTLPAKQVEQLKAPEDILFLDQFNWRIERCLIPIDNSWEPIYLSVLNKYSPFIRRTRKDVKEAWVNLKLGLLRLYREEGWLKKWRSLNKELFALRYKFSIIQQCRYAYEQALMATYQSDFKGLEKVLNQWPEQKTDPYWDVCRGSLWAEYISLEKGAKITKKSFNAISAKFQAAETEKDRFLWGSRMVHAHTVWNSMSQANYVLNTDVTDEARNTWVNLRPYDDIWYERDFFEIRLRSIEQAAQVKIKVASFELGKTRTSTNLSGNAKDYRIAYAFFRYYEETAFPIHLPYLNAIDKATLEKALSVMEYCSPAIAENWLLRSGDPKIVSAVFNRRYLALKSKKDVAEAYTKHLNLLRLLLKTDVGDTVPSWVIVFRNILPEILSRLCMKANYKDREDTIILINQIYSARNSVQYEGVPILLSSLLSSFTNEQVNNLIPRLLDMPIAYDKFDDYGHEPFFYLKELGTYDFQIAHETIDSLFDKLGESENNDKFILYRLLFLQRCGALDSEEQNRLAEELWLKRDDFGFPTRTPFAKFAFLALPHPSDVNPQELLRNYISNSHLPRMGKGQSVSFFGGKIQLLNEIKGTNNTDIDFSWDSELLNSVCADILDMWDTDKDRLNDNTIVFGTSVREELEGRLKDVKSVLVGVIAKYGDFLTEKNKRGVAKMIEEMEQHGIPAFRVQIAFAPILNTSIDVNEEIDSRLGASDERIVDDCLSAIVYLDQKGQNTAKWVEKISEYFRGGCEKGRIYYINVLNYFEDKKDYKISENTRKNLLIGLGRLFAATTVQITDTELVVNEKMNLRRLVAPIVRRLVSDGIDDSHDLIISRYREYYENEETCLDVRNCYYDGV